MDKLIPWTWPPYIRMRNELLKRHDKESPLFHHTLYICLTSPKLCIWYIIFPSITWGRTWMEWRMNFNVSEIINSAMQTDGNYQVSTLNTDPHFFSFFPCTEFNHSPVYMSSSSRVPLDWNLSPRTPTPLRTRGHRHLLGSATFRF